MALLAGQSFPPALTRPPLKSPGFHGRWLLRPKKDVLSVKRRYVGDSLVLETEFRTRGGTAAVIDFMPLRTDWPDLVRIVEGRQGIVPMELELEIRFDYGSLVPWVRSKPGELFAVAGPDAVVLRTPVKLEGEDFHTVANFTVGRGDRTPFVLSWHSSHLPPPPAENAEELLAETVRWWSDWCARSTYSGEWSDAVTRSLITLRALTYGPTGGIVASPTTSLPEKLGGTRNWDYRYCWLRDATFTLFALIQAGYLEEADGELMDALHAARCQHLPTNENSWRLQKALLSHLEKIWREPDEGIWEVRGKRRQFTHSKVMAWVAVDRAVKSAMHFGLSGPVERWRKLRDLVHADVCRNGYNPEVGAFVQTYGSQELDASLLAIPLVGFSPPGDPQVRGTVDAIEKNLMVDGLVKRYDTKSGVDGRFIGNFPQAFSHVALVNSARNLSSDLPPEERPDIKRAKE